MPKCENFHYVSGIDVGSYTILWLIFWVTCLDWRSGMLILSSNAHNRDWHCDTGGKATTCTICIPSGLWFFFSWLFHFCCSTPLTAEVNRELWPSYSTWVKDLAEVPVCWFSQVTIPVNVVIWGVKQWRKKICLPSVTAVWSMAHSRSLPLLLSHSVALTCK